MLCDGDDGTGTAVANGCIAPQLGDRLSVVGLGGVADDGGGVGDVFVVVDAVEDAVGGVEVGEGAALTEAEVAVTAAAAATAAAAVAAEWGGGTEGRATGAGVGAPGRKCWWW